MIDRYLSSSHREEKKGTRDERVRPGGRAPGNAACPDGLLELWPLEDIDASQRERLLKTLIRTVCVCVSVRASWQQGSAWSEFYGGGRHYKNSRSSRHHNESAICLAAEYLNMNQKTTLVMAIRVRKNIMYVYIV